MSIWRTPTRPFDERMEKWSRIVFNFDGYGAIQGSLSQFYRSANVFISYLPVKLEGIVLDNVEILIQLPSVLRTKISRRVHDANLGDIIYRPQIPAIGIIADHFEVYEPVERIGTINKQDLDMLIKIASEAKSVLLVDIKLAGES
ncbi:MAG: cyclophilin-like fold protein [Candidatus Njordarchaeia archaeon]|nr:hypothetical protein [Candidatus Korarchaeota archaeon]